MECAPYGGQFQAAVLTGYAHALETESLLSVLPA
jgi:hypothetical protein